jgi:hypothetical protein
MGIIPHSASHHNLDFLATGKTRDFVVICDFWIQTDVSEVLRNLSRLQDTETQAFAGGFVVIKFLDKLSETQV